MKQRIRRPSPAMIVASLALILAMTGTAFAAGMIGSGQIKDGSIRPVDIRDNSLTGNQIRENKLSSVPNADKAATATNADQADKLTSTATTALKTRWFILDENGAIAEQSGGFTVLDAYDTNANAYIDTGSSLVGKGLAATIQIQNQIDLDPVTAGIQSSRNGETAVTRCQIPGVVECAPANAKTLSALAVTASNPDGTPAATPSPGTGAGTSTKRIYVEITE